MNIQQNISLKPYNTFGIDVTASRFVSVDSFYSLQEILTQEKDVFLLSGGSNMLLTKNINKLVVHINSKGISIDRENENDVHITVNAGEDWHDFVLWCISQNYGGLENLSLIPGHDLRYAIDSTKLKNELGWEPSLQFEEGIEKTVTWYLKNNEWMEKVTSGKYQEYYQKMYNK